MTDSKLVRHAYDVANAIEAQGSAAAFDVPVLLRQLAGELSRHDAAALRQRIDALSDVQVMRLGLTWEENAARFVGGALYEAQIRALREALGRLLTEPTP